MPHGNGAHFWFTQLTSLKDRRRAKGGASVNHMNTCTGHENFINTGMEDICRLQTTSRDFSSDIPSLSFPSSPLLSPPAYRPVMAVEVAGTLLHWCQQPLTSSSSICYKTLAFAFAINTPGRSVAHHIGHKSYFHGTAIIHRSHQSGRTGERRSRARAPSSASLDGFGFFDDGKDDEDEFEKRINDCSSKFMMEFESRMIQDAETSNSGGESAPSSSPVTGPVCRSLLSVTSEVRSMRPDLGLACDDGFAPDMVELRANSFDLPLSLRILKQKKKKWESVEMADSAYSSVKKAFSSMVFIVRELQSHTIRMRESLFSSSKQQIQGILTRVHDELHASFVWLFQRIFSTTPTLMVYLMLLLANFTIFSITDYPANANPPTQSVSAAVEESHNPSLRLDSSAVKSFSVGRSAAVGGGGGSGKKPQPVAGAADDGRWDRSSSSCYNRGTISPEVVSTALAKEDNAEKAWKGIVEAAERIRASGRHEALMDPDTLRRFVSPVTVELEPDDLSAYAVTEFSYRRVLAEGFDDPLILSNFAQFLYVVLGDHDRAEEYFKRAALAEPADAEALSRYANFLWVARKDLGAAEETFLEAIEADPGNSYYSANYAHFLWSTGGEDTCYPPDACDS